MKKFECDICKKRFDTETSLKQHQNSKHFQEQKTAAKEETKPITITKKQTKRLLVYLVILAIVGFIGFGVYKAVTNQNPIGVLGSTHIHTDIGVFLDGQEMTPFPPKYYVRNQYMHVETGPGAGTVMHMHATNVPLNLFFKSLGMDFNSECFKLDTRQQYCNSGDKALKMYVKHANGEWEQNLEYEKYIFKDLDKILISFGNESEEQLKLQMGNVTDFSKDNSGRTMEVG